MVSKFLCPLFLLFCFCHPCLGQIHSKTQLPCEHALRGPAWLQSAVIYSVFPRNFSQSGDFTGIHNRLDQIKELGIDIIWILPIHPIGELKKKGTFGSPYAVQDYKTINPVYGTEKDLKELVAKAHQLGLKVILDAVLNHTAWDHVLINHPDFYQCNRDGQVIPPHPEWSDVAALDYTNPMVQSYLLDILKYWLMECDLDGFRFDASDFIPVDFWKKVREELHQIKSDIVLLGEGDRPEALCTGLDLDYDWKLKNALDNVLINGAPATETIQMALKQEKELFPRRALHLRFSDNHDERRAIARYGEKGALAASALIFTLEGVPLIYNGMEVGDTTESCAPALFEKMPIFWDSNQIRPEFKTFYKKIIALRKQHASLRESNLEWIKNPNEERILTFLKKSDDETLLIALNLSNQPFMGSIAMQGSFEELLEKESARSPASLPMLSLGAFEFRIFKAKF